VSLERLADLFFRFMRELYNAELRFTQFVPSRLYGVIAWAGFIGTWKGDCPVCSSCVQDLTMCSLFVRSCNNIYQVLKILREDRATTIAPA
jgi:hypothetical protein